MNILPHLENFLAQLIAALPAAIAIIVGALIFKLIVDRGLRLLADKTSLEPSDVAPFRRVANWFITAAAAVLLLMAFGFRIGGLWTTLTTVLAMVAVGFVAVWSVLSNWLCTLVILITRPFAIGDHVEFAGEPVNGRVVDLNFFFTTLESEDGSTAQVPNNLFFQKVIKRRRGAGSISLAEQLNRREPAAA